MIDRKCNARESLMHQLAEDDLKDWIVADRHQGLGQDNSVRPQSRPNSAGQNNRTLRHGINYPCTSEDSLIRETIRLSSSAPFANRSRDESPTHLSAFSTRCDP